MPSKLTLSVDSEIVEQAKQYARRQGVSVSKLVENYFAAITQPTAGLTEGPILRALRGSLKNGTKADYNKHLEQKYL